MEKEKIGNINYDLKLFEVREDDDPRFLKAIISVCHDGWNRNDSYMSLDVIKETAEKSLRGTPVTGFLKYDEDGSADFAGHEEEIIITEEGEIDYRYLGAPFGYVHHNAEFWYEEKTFNGVERTYLMTEVILWKKFEHTKVFMKSPDKFHSMELHPDNYTVKWSEELEGRSGHEFTEMMFDAFCILGDTVPPAMIGSAMKEFNKKFNATSFKKMMDETDKIIGGAKVTKKKTKKEFELSSDEKRKALSDFITSKVEGSWGVSDFDSTTVCYSVYNYKDETRKLYLANYTVDSEGMVTVDLENAKEAVFKIMPKEDEQEIGMLVGFSDLAKKFEITLEENFNSKMFKKDIEVAYEINKLKDELVEFDGTKKEFAETKEKLSKIEADLEKAKENLNEFEKENKEFRKKEKLKEINNVANLSKEDKEKLIDEVDKFTFSELKDEIIKVIGRNSIKYSVTTDVEDTISDPIRSFSNNNEDELELTDEDKALKIANELLKEDE